MTARTILVTLDGNDTCEAVLMTALDLAQEMDAHLDVLHVRADPLSAVPNIAHVTPGLADDSTEAAAKAGTQQARLARALFDKACAAQAIEPVAETEPATGFSVTWLERVGRRHKVLARLARVHDLTLTGQPSNPKDPLDSLTVKALFDTGRPVLIVPPDFKGPIGGTMAIAWNGSPECARALGGATTFFPLMRKIVILTAENEDTPVSVVPELETYLRRHGHQPETSVFAHLGRQKLTGDTLLKACDEVGANILVMGAHNTGSIKNIALGRSTRGILHGAPIPVLMGH